jgi:hypothetical protein
MAKKQPSQYDSDDFPIEPKPRTSILNLLLCVLNIAAAGAFVYFLQLDLEKRRAWSLACLMTDVRIVGLPQANEDKGPQGVVETDPKPALLSEDLKDAYNKRKPGGPPLKGEFISPDQMPKPRITPKDLDDGRLKSIFSGLGDAPVATLEAEVLRVNGIVLNDINAAAVEAAKAETDKRKKLEIVLLAFAADAYELAALDKMLRATDDSKLEDLLAAAYERRMLLDILKPVEYHRWGDPKLPYLSLKNTSDLSGLNIDELKENLTGRLKNAAEEDVFRSKYYRGVEEGKARNAVEKRDNIACLLFTIAHVQKPDGKLLYERGAERTQTVLGLYAFADAAEKFNTAMKTMADQLIEKIEEDRQGVLVKMNKKQLKDYIDKKMSDKNISEAELKQLSASYEAMDAKDSIVFRTTAFTENYRALIDELRQRSREIEEQEKILHAKTDQKDKAKRAFEAGVDEVKAKEKDLRVERTNTAKLLVEVQAVQNQLFRSQRELATAHDDNEELARRIRQMEIDQARFEGLIPAKGKTP